MAEPGRTTKSLFVELQERYPGQYRDVLQRTLRRAGTRMAGEYASRV